MRLAQLAPLLLLPLAALAQEPTTPPHDAPNAAEVNGPSASGRSSPSGPARGGARQTQELVRQAAAVEENPDWAVTLERIASSVVSINVNSTRAFDTEWNSTAEATGFVVDAEQIGRASWRER